MIASELESDQERVSAPLVSLIVPYSLAGERLERALDDLRAQSYRPIEVIVVDDGAHEPSRYDVLKRCREAGTAVVEHSGHGLAAALNAGVRCSAGEFFMPIVGDLIEPPYVADAVSRMLAEPQLGVVHCHDGLSESPGAAFSLKAQLLRNSVRPTALFRTADWRKVGGFDERMHDDAAEHDYIMRLLTIGRSVHRLEGSYLQHAPSRAAAPDSAHAAGRIREARQERRDRISDHARMMRNNADFYVDHADLLWEQIFELMDERDELRHRLAALG